MIAKKIAVLGGGHGAHIMAADLAMKGHTVNMFEMPHLKHNMAKVFRISRISKSPATAFMSPALIWSLMISTKLLMVSIYIILVTPHLLMVITPDCSKPR